MHSCRLLTFGSLSIAATAQIGSWTTTQPSVTLPYESGVLFGGQYSTTLAAQSPPYTVYKCDFEAEAHYGGFSRAETCNAISTVTTISSETSADPTGTSTAAPGNRHVIDPASVLEARMERKFGVKARSIPTIFENGQTPLFPSIVTVTSTTTLLSIPESCAPSPSPMPFPIFHDLPMTASFPAAEVTAMSIVANMLKNDIAALALTADSTQLPSNIVSIMVNILTANVSTMTVLSSTSSTNMSITSASLTSVSSAPPFTATSGGTSAKVGVLAAIIAAISVACLLA